jgi:hypothetical protein
MSIAVGVNATGIRAICYVLRIFTKSAVRFPFFKQCVHKLRAASLLSVNTDRSWPSGSEKTRCFGSDLLHPSRPAADFSPQSSHLQQSD